MKQSSIKKFVLDYLDSNEIKFELDKNHIYTAKFEEVLGNKLGLERKFTFNREISDDYGVEYISRYSDLTKIFLRDSLNKGQIVKATIEFPVKIEDKINLSKTILIKKQQDNKSTAICFMFRISSTNVHDNQPDSIKFIIIDYEKCSIFPEEITSEFHNFDFKKSTFKFDPKNVVKSHSVAYGTLEKELNQKYEEYGDVNRALLDKQIKEMEDRHENFKRECKIEISNQKEKCNYFEKRINAARTTAKERDYRKELNSAENKLELIETENKKRINLNFVNTETRIDDLKNQYDFEVNVYLVGAVVFEYGIKELTLHETQSDEEINLTYNLLSNSIQNFICPTCSNESTSFNVSVNGHFCCHSCSTYQENNKGYLCKKDNVEKCVMTGSYIQKKKKNQCETCEKYFDKSLLKKDIMDKITCPLCLVKTYSGELINKKDAIFSKKYQSNFKPDDVTKCSFSGDYYLLNDISTTTGSGKIVANEHIFECKYTRLTFVKNEMYDDKTSKLVSELKEIKKSEIKFDQLRDSIKKNMVSFNENKLWALVRTKGLLRFKYILYDKKKKEVITF